MHLFCQMKVHQTQHLKGCIGWLYLVLMMLIALARMSSWLACLFFHADSRATMKVMNWLQMGVSDNSHCQDLK